MDNQMAEAEHFGMGTEITHKAYGERAQEALRAVRDEAARLENLLSRFLEDSEIGRINTSAGIRDVAISPETYWMLEQAREFSGLSHGLFDTTISPLADLWDYKHATQPPADARIRQTLSLVDYRKLRVDPAKKTAFLQEPGQSVDLGGIAKGYASDRLMEIFQEYGIRSAYSNLGGNVSTLGNKPDGSPWRVGIRHPRMNGLIGAVEVTGQAVVTSGDYERYFIGRDGRRYHHILNPFTGYPADSGLVSVTVIAPSALTADALSTALFVAGMERGLSYLPKYPPAEAVFVDTDMRVTITRGIRDRFRSAGAIKINII